MVVELTDKAESSIQVCLILKIGLLMAIGLAFLKFFIFKKTKIGNKKTKNTKNPETIV